MAEETPRLTRRDALGALAAAGVVVGLEALTGESPDGATESGETSASDDSRPLGAHEYETLTELAGVVYPEAVEGVGEFVRAYAAGRAENSPQRARAIAEAVATLDERAVRTDGTRYADLPSERQEGLLTEMGVDVVDPNPDGIVAARLRYYLVNELLFALYASPTGGRLVGIENPQGHPGGVESYRRGPDG